jgi:hypothetical protein
LFSNCVFLGNRAEVDGGGFHNYGPGDPCADEEGTGTGVPKFVNCLFVFNHADGGKGGALYSDPLGGLQLRNCTIANNGADSVTGGIYHANQGCPGTNFGGQTNLYNSILWGNTGSSQFSPTDRGTVDHCDIEGNGNNDPNIDEDPDFDLTFHLQSGSPCIDVGSNSIINASDVYDVDQDSDNSEATPDLDLNARIISGGVAEECTVDMGCFEFASIGCPGDANHDEFVNTADLLLVINHWGNCPNPPALCPGDVSPTECGDGLVNTGDLLEVISNWGCHPLNYSGEGGIAGSFPQSVQDCLDDASEYYEPHSEQWNNFVNRCIEYLCTEHIIDDCE